MIWLRFDAVRLSFDCSLTALLPSFDDQWQKLHVRFSTCSRRMPWSAKKSQKQQTLISWSSMRSGSRFRFLSNVLLHTCRLYEKYCNFLCLTVPITLHCNPNLCKTHLFDRFSVPLTLGTDLHIIISNEQTRFILLLFLVCDNTSVS